MKPARAQSLAKFAGGAVLVTTVAALFVSIASTRRPGQVRRRRQRRPIAGSPLQAASGLLALSVLLDSSVEHYRGSFKNPGMAAPLLTSGAAVIARGGAAAGRDSGRLRTGSAATAIAIGGLGTIFHVFNIAKRPGGFGWLNLFYSAPPGAPAALALSGLLGLAADQVASEGAEEALFLNMASGPALAALSTAGILGTTAESALLHYRGAFQNPFMFVPVTLPPTAALLLGIAAFSRSERAAKLARIALVTTAAAGIAGVGFHAYGVSRGMGGWRNWSQNLLDGPPLPAPPAFTAFSIAGLAALSLLESDRQ